MTEVVILPAISIIQGVEFYQEYRFDDVDGPIDLTGWTATAALSDAPFNAPFWTGVPTLASNGVITVTIPAATTLEFPVKAKVGGVGSAVFQIRLTAPAPEFHRVWQGPAIIAGVFK